MADTLIPEEWRGVADFPGYEVSNLGRVRSRKLYGFKILKTPLGIRGYPRVTLRRDGKNFCKQIHALVCAAFHGAAPTPFHGVAHWDGNKLNPAASNLRWATPAENSADTIRHGNAPRGMRNASHVLKPEHVLKIREMLKNGMTQTEISEIFMVHNGTISRIHRRTLWGWLE
jgi:hypothetical protein